MKYIKLLILVSSIAFVFIQLQSCREKIPSPINAQAVEELKGLKSIGVYDGNTAIVSFNESKHQLYLKSTASGNTFRMLTHDALTYFDVVFNTAESYKDGDVLNVAIKSTGFDEVKERELTMLVVKTDNTNMWLIEKANIPQPLGLIIYWEP